MEELRNVSMAGRRIRPTLIDAEEQGQRRGPRTSFKPRFGGGEKSGYRSYGDKGSYGEKSSYRTPYSGKSERPYRERSSYGRKERSEY